MVISDKWRKKLLNELHRDHPGICKIKNIAGSYIWWPGINKDIESLVKSCTDCLAVKCCCIEMKTLSNNQWLWIKILLQFPAIPHISCSEAAPGLLNCKVCYKL